MNDANLPATLGMTHLHETDHVCQSHALRLKRCPHAANHQPRYPELEPPREAPTCNFDCQPSRCFEHILTTRALRFRTKPTSKPTLTRLHSPPFPRSAFKRSTFSERMAPCIDDHSTGLGRRLPARGRCLSTPFRE